MKRKSKLIFMFETNGNGIMVTTKVKGKLKLEDVICAKKVIEDKLKDLKADVKDKRK